MVNFFFNEKFPNILERRINALNERIPLSFYGIFFLHKLNEKLNRTQWFRNSLTVACSFLILFI